MKPKTELHHSVIELAKKIKPITETQLNWAKNHCFKYQAILSKQNIATCLNCSHEYSAGITASAKNTVCPSCNKKLKIWETLKRKSKDWQYFTIFDSINEFQILRHFKIEVSFLKGAPATFSCKEVAHIWINNKGISTIYSCLHYDSFYCDTWTGDFEIRDKITLTKYDIATPFVFPKQKLIPELKRTGFKGRPIGHDPEDFLSKLITSSKYETLYKAKQLALIKLNQENTISKHWGSILICIRNNYIVKDARTWIDYLDLLNYFGKDLRNSKYVCPADLIKEHDRLVKKKSDILRRIKKEELMSTIEEQDKEYKEARSKYFNLNFMSDDIQIKVINSVELVYEISELHQHCVFTNEYHRKDDSLLMIAIRKGELLETIELSLQNYKIRQSQGVKNKPTKYHKEIKNIIHANINRIKEISLAS